MKKYNRPVLKSYCSEKMVEKLGFIQAQYAVQFSIQAIEFQVSENSSGENQTIHTVNSLVKQPEKAA